jgi:hypothetical protein
MADVITALQDETSAIATMLYDFIGTLQRDAPPASIAGEPVMMIADGAAAAGRAPSTATIRDVPAAAKQMADQLVASFQRAHSLVDRLPQDVGALEQEPEREAEDARRIAALLRERDAADADLRASAERGERALAALHALHARCAEALVKSAAGAEAARVELPQALTGTGRRR